MFANKDIEQQNFWLHPKLMLPQSIYTCVLVVIILVGTNKGKYCEIEVHFAKQDVTFG
jgi:hypothetical protein